MSVFIDVSVFIDALNSSQEFSAGQMNPRLKTGQLSKNNYRTFNKKVSKLLEELGTLKTELEHTVLSIVLTGKGWQRLPEKKGPGSGQFRARDGRRIHAYFSRHA